MKKESKTEFVNRTMGLSFRSTQGKYSFCNDDRRQVLFSLDVKGGEDDDLILSPNWARRGYAHSINHIDKVLNDGYELLIYKVKTKKENGKTILVGFNDVLEKRKLVVEEGGVYRAIALNDDDIEMQIRNSTDLSDTEKEQLVRSRRGQGRFRRELEKIEPRCRVTGLSDKQHLKASHIKPWRNSSNSERLDGNNGLLLTPHIDHLFDRGYISFADNGKILLSVSLSHEVAQVFGVLGLQPTGSFNDGQKSYLAYHREKVFIHD